MSRESDRAINAFTVDLEDWFQGLTSTNPLVERWPAYESRVVPATRKLLKLLHAHDVQATFFVLGYVAERQPDLIAEIVQGGHEIASHGYFHRFVYKLTPNEFLEDIVRTNEVIQQACGVYPKGYRAPYFSVNASTPWLYEYLAAAGMVYDASIFPTRNMLYGWPQAPKYPFREARTGLLELPSTTIRIGALLAPVSGGFYMRALPYAFVRWALERVNGSGQPAIIYVHPWELDTGQDYPYVTARERVTHYHGRRGLESKLKRLFSDFSFTSISQLMGTIDAPTIDITGCNSSGRLSTHSIVRKEVLAKPVSQLYDYGTFVRQTSC